MPFVEAAQPAFGDTGFSGSSHVVPKNHNWSDPTDTFGCSPSPIIADAGLGNGHSKKGISNSALAPWVAAVMT
jgi:hypothetical protein